MVFYKMPYYVAFIMMTLITISEMLAFSVLVNFWMSRTDDTNRGQYAAIWTMVWAFSQTVGPFLGSVIAQYAGFKVFVVNSSFVKFTGYFFVCKNYKRLNDTHRHYIRHT
jgi:MFS family permease